MEAWRHWAQEVRRAGGASFSETLLAEIFIASLPAEWEKRIRQVTRTRPDLTWEAIRANLDERFAQSVSAAALRSKWANLRVRGPTSLDMEDWWHQANKFGYCLILSSTEWYQYCLTAITTQHPELFHERIGGLNATLLAAEARGTPFSATRMVEWTIHCLRDDEKLASNARALGVPKRSSSEGRSVRALGTTSPTPAPRPTGAAEQKCFNCGRPGHWQRECPQLQRSTPGRLSECLNCGQRGHVASDCKNPTVC